MVNIEALLDRAFMSIEDGNFIKADELLEQVLNLNSKSAKAYVGKLMVELKVQNEMDLQNQVLPITENINFKRAIQFADKEFREILLKYNQTILERIENERKENIYQQANNRKISCNNEFGFREISKCFQSISGYKDADYLAEECDILAEKSGVEAENIAEINEINRVNKMKFIKKVTPIILGVIIIAIFFNIVMVPATKYKKAVDLFESKQYYEAAAIFGGLGNYKDSKVQLESAKYNEALNLVKNNKYDEAITILNDLGDYKDSKAQLESAKYNEALNLVNDKKYDEAITVLNELGNYKDSNEQLKSAKYCKGLVLLQNKQYYQARLVFYQIKGYKDASLYFYKLSNAASKLISAGGFYTAGLKNDGTLYYAYSSEAEFPNINLSHCFNISAISSGYKCIAGLKSDGTVVSCDGLTDTSGKLDTSSWSNIVSISTGYDSVAGLKGDGTVVVDISNASPPQDFSAISEWKNMVAISCGNAHIVGLKSDGTLVATGGNYNGQCNVTEWKDIVAISSGCNYTVGLKSDGTVVAAGEISSDISGWKDIVAISAGSRFLLGLKDDGTVVSVGAGSGHGEVDSLDISKWRDIVAISAGQGITGITYAMGLKSDGTVVATKNAADAVSGWDDIVITENQVK